MQIEFIDDLSGLSVEELEALNQDMGKVIDAVRAYRQRINAVRDEKEVQNKVWEAVKDIPGSARVLAQTVGMDSGVIPLGD